MRVEIVLTSEQWSHLVWRGLSESESVAALIRDLVEKDRLKHQFFDATHKRTAEELAEFTRGRRPVRVWHKPKGR